MIAHERVIGFVMDKNKFLKSLPDPEDKLSFAKAFDRFETCRVKHLPTFTDFLDPARGEKFLRVFEKEAEVFVRAFGGYGDAERKMLGFAAHEIPPEEAFPVAPLTVTFNERFSKAPSHRDYLGSILGLGIDRAKIGDIRIGESGAVIYAASEIAEYIAENLTRVGRVAVKISAGGALPGLRESGAQVRVTVASLRLDAVVSAAFHISRGKSAALIEGEKVFVNWKPVLNGAKTLAEGDVVTARGLGRVKVEGEAGRTKKDRVSVIITKY
ncbi:MAG: hypothetical protein LBR83_00390 [Clostridiales bacterium]|nr:hypothetical protein [Clostridiales bacterium]